MKKIILCLVITILSANTFALSRTCPAAINYRHLSAGADWELSADATNQGWVIAGSPVANYYTGTTPPANPLHVVLNNVNQSNGFIMTCKSELMPDKNGLTMDAVLAITQADPKNNPAFKQINANTYVCETTIDHPETCVSHDVLSAQQKNDFTGGSIN